MGALQVWLWMRARSRVLFCFPIFASYTAPTHTGCGNKDVVEQVNSSQPGHFDREEAQRLRPSLAPCTPPCTHDKQPRAAHLSSAPAVERDLTGDLRWKRMRGEEDERGEAGRREQGTERPGAA